jgi:hypothetical protein
MARMLARGWLIAALALAGALAGPRLALADTLAQLPQFAKRPRPFPG